MDIMEEVNRTENTSTEGAEEASYVGMIPTERTEIIDELTGADPVFPDKRLKTFVPPDLETISYPVISRFIIKLQVYLNKSAEEIFGDQAIIFLLNRTIVDVPEYHTKIW